MRGVDGERKRLRAWRNASTPERKQLTDSLVLTLIRAVHVILNGACGSPRLTKVPRGYGFPARMERVEQLMREMGSRSPHKRRYKAKTDSSIRRAGETRHNVPTESFYNSLKDERVHGACYGTRAEDEADLLFDYNEPHYKHRRKHSTLGQAPPRQLLDDRVMHQYLQPLSA